MSQDARGRGRSHRKYAAAIACLAVLVCAPAAPARAPIETILQDDAALLHRSDAEVAENMSRLHALGVDRVRLTAGWSVLAPDADAAVRPDFDATDPNAYPLERWRNLDRAVRAAKLAGLDVMIDVAFWAPLWATNGDPNEGRARWNIDPAEYAAFTKAVVRRYSGSFTPAPAQPDAAPEGGQGSEEPPPSRDASLMDDVFGGGSSRDSRAENDDDWVGIAMDGAGSGSGDGSGDAGADGQGAGSPEPSRTEEPLPAVRWWTIWNEPNHPGFIQPQWDRSGGGAFTPKSPHIYRRLVEAAYPVIKEIQPDSTVLVGGTSSTGAKRPTSVTSGVPPLRFVRELACVDERLRPLTTPECANYKPLPGDGFSHHPYSLLHKPDYGDPKNSDNLPIGDLDRLTKTLDKLVKSGRIAPKIAEVYLTEFGYETNPPDPIKPFNPEQQARFLNWSEYLAWRNPRVRSWPQFLLNDLGTVSTADAERGKREFGDWQSGLHFADGSPKPSATSFKLALFAECSPLAGASRKARSSRSKRGGRPESRSARVKRIRRERARRSQGRTVMVWGHVRPGSGPREVSITMRRGAGDWQATASASRRSRRAIKKSSSSRPFSTDAGGTFIRYVPYVRGAQYRLESGSGSARESGLNVSPVNCGRR